MKALNEVLLRLRTPLLYVAVSAVMLSLVIIIAASAVKF